MKLSPILKIQLNAKLQDYERLRSLQALFSEVCNFISPVAKTNRCWNRVALHHLVYREVRDKFPQLGSQMTCNAVYSVCRMYRLVFENLNSPLCLPFKNASDIPLIKFLDSNPVYFDRHTLTFKQDKLSIFTLEGRLHFEIFLDEKSKERFAVERLHEITLFKSKNDYELIFSFAGFKEEAQKIIDLMLPNYVVLNSDDGNKELLKKYAG